MNGRISWVGVFVRLIGAVAVVLLTYNPTGYSFYHWAMRDFAAITAVKAFAGALLLVGWVVCIRTAFVALGALGLVLRARARHSGLDAQGLWDSQPWQSVSTLMGYVDHNRDHSRHRPVLVVVARACHRSDRGGLKISWFQCWKLRGYNDARFLKSYSWGSACPRTSYHCITDQFLRP